MTRFAIAAAIVTLSAACSEAQPVPLAPPGPGGGKAPAPAPTPAPIVIPVTSAKPPSGYYKSGGVLVGADGYYPFDTGHYLLGGFDGLTRSSGTYFMVPSGTANGPPQTATHGSIIIEHVPIDAAPAISHRGRIIHRR
jgi:hypothetical protein